MRPAPTEPEQSERAQRAHRGRPGRCAEEGGRVGRGLVRAIVGLDHRRPRDELEAALHRQHHLGLEPVAPSRREVTELRGRERARHGRVGVDVAHAARPADAAAQPSAPNWKCDSSEPPAAASSLASPSSSDVRGGGARRSARGVSSSEAAGRAAGALAATGAAVASLGAGASSGAGVGASLAAAAQVARLAAVGALGPPCLGRDREHHLVEHIGHDRRLEAGRERDVRIDLQRLVELPAADLALAEAGDDDDAEMNVRARRDRVVVEARALAQLERLLERLARAVEVLLLIQRHALAVELDHLRDRLLLVRRGVHDRRGDQHRRREADGRQTSGVDLRHLNEWPDAHGSA